MLANLFMHYAFDLWLGREFPLVKFERYADDAVIHCVSEHQARKVLASLHERMAEVGLELHPDKTKIVYCKDSNRRGSHEHTSFTFLGFTYRPRQARRKDGKQFTSFLPAISKDALKKISAEVRSWRLHRWVTSDGPEIARFINPKIRGLRAPNIVCSTDGALRALLAGVLSATRFASVLLRCRRCPEQPK